MYQPTPLQFHSDQVAHLLGLALSLNLQPGPGGAGMTPQSETRLLFEPVLKPYFSGTWYACTVVGLWPSQQIPLHADAKILGVRYHLPLQTNLRCLSFTEAEDGVIYCHKLYEGQVYTLDPTLPHGAVNWGSEVRLHLMIDVEGA